MRVAVVGHVEWIDFIRVEKLPASGQILHATEWWEEPGGGGSVAAAQLAKLAGKAGFFTALADSDLGHRAYRELTALGVGVKAQFYPAAQRRGITFIDRDGERTITVLGKRFGPAGADALAWDELDGADAVYLTAGDVEAVRQARRARVLVSTSRVVPLLAQARVQLDAIVGSSADPSEVYNPGDIEPRPRLVVRTAGSRGGTYQVDGAKSVDYRPAPVPGRVVDTYGAGDSFAAGLTFGLGAGLSPEEAVSLAARCGAAVLMGRGPFSSQLRAEAIEIQGGGGEVASTKQ